MIRLHRRSTFKAVLAAAALILVSTTVSTAAPRPEHPLFKGLPGDDRVSAYLLDPAAVSIGYAPAQKQWFRVPESAVAVYNVHSRDVTDRSCRNPTFEGRFQAGEYTPQAYFVPTGEAPAPFGYIGPIKVRTVAFGSIPVEATVLLAQERDENDQPIPFNGHQLSGKMCPGRGPNAAPGQQLDFLVDTYVRGQARVLVSKISVDGVDLRFADTCRSKTPFDLALTAPDVYSNDPALGRTGNPFFLPRTTGIPPDSPAYNPEDDIDYIMASKWFIFTWGGKLSATFDLPNFEGCQTTQGDNLGPLLDATVAGPGNYAEVRAQGLTGEADADSCRLAKNCTERTLRDIPIPTTPPPAG